MTRKLRYVVSEIAALAFGILRGLAMLAILILVVVVAVLVCGGSVPLIDLVWP